MAKYKKGQIQFTDLSNKFSTYNRQFLERFRIEEIIDISGNILAKIFTTGPYNYSKTSGDPPIQNLQELAHVCQEYDDEVVSDPYSPILYKIMVALCRLNYPLGLTEKNRGFYQNYVRKYRKITLTELIDNDFQELIYKQPQLFVTRYNIDNFIESANNTQKIDLQAFLLGYKHSKLRMDELSNKTAALTLIDPNSYKEIQKNWMLADVTEPEITLAGYKGKETPHLLFPKIAGKKSIINVGTKFMTADKKLYHPSDLNIIIPEGYKLIKELAFSYHSGLRKITLPDSIIEIGKGAFQRCKNLEEVDLGSQLIFINQAAFYDCTSLRKIKIPDNVRVIGKNAFYKCSGLEEVELGKNLEIIDEKAFANCPKLTKIILPPSLRYIAASAFNNKRIREFFKESEKKTLPINTSRTRIVNRDNISDYIKEYSQSILLPDDIIILDTSGYSWPVNMETITLSQNLAAIPDYAFTRSPNLRSLKIPDKVAVIGEFAFADCWALENLEIGNSVRLIKTRAFWGCPKLTIRAQKGSYVIEYAKKNKIKFVEL